MGVISLLKVEWLDHRAVRCRAVLSAFGGRLTDHQRLEILWVRRGSNKKGSESRKKKGLGGRKWRETIAAFVQWGWWRGPWGHAMGAIPQRIAQRAPGLWWP